MRKDAVTNIVVDTVIREAIKHDISSFYSRLLMTGKI